MLLNQDPKYSGYSAWRGHRKIKPAEEFILHLVLEVILLVIQLIKKEMLVLLRLKKKIINLKNHGKKRALVKDLLDDFSIYDSKIFPALEDSMPLYKWGIYIRPPLKSMIQKYNFAW